MSHDIYHPVLATPNLTIMPSLFFRTESLGIGIDLELGLTLLRDWSLPQFIVVHPSDS